MHFGTFTREWIEMFSKMGYKERRETGGGRWEAEAPPDASWAHLQVQRSLSLSLVLNWVPAWVRLLVRPAVPLKPSAWRLELGEQKKKLSEKLSRRRRPCLVGAPNGNCPDFSVSESNYCHVCKLNTAQSCLPKSASLSSFNTAGYQRDERGKISNLASPAFFGLSYRL